MTTSAHAKRSPEVAVAAIVDRWAHRNVWDSGESALILGERGAGQRSFLQALEVRVRAIDQYVVSLWITPNRPPLMSSLLLAELLGVHDIEHLTATEVARRLRRAMRDADASSRPLLVLVHDLQNLPDEDAAILGDLICAPPAGPVLVVAAAADRRSDGSLWRALPALSERARQGGMCEVVDVGRLSHGDVRSAVEGRVGTGAAAPRFVREIARATAGRLDDLEDCLSVIEELEPRLRSELLAASRTLHALPVTGGIAERALCAEQVLTSDAQHVSAALAIWEESAPIEVIEAITSLTGRTLENAIADLLQHGVIEESRADGSRLAFRLTEPLVGLALLKHASPLLRRRFHRAAATLLESAVSPLTDDEAVALARYCFEGDLELDDGRVNSIGRSAEALVSHSRFAEAREQLLNLERVLRSRPGGDPGGRSVLPAHLAPLLAEALSRSGELGAAEDVLSVASAPGETDIAIALRRARDRVARGQHQEAWDIYAPILARENSGRDPAITQARLEAASVLRSIGLTEEAIHQRRMGVREAEEAGDTRLTVEARMSQHRALYAAGRPNEALRFGREAFFLARGLGSGPMIARATSALGAVFYDLYSLKRGMRWSRRAMLLAEAADDFATVSGAGHRLASVLLDAGDFTGAERVALRVMHSDADMHRSRALPRAHSLLRMIHALRGGRDDGTSETMRFWDGREPLDLGYSLYSEVVARYTEQMVDGAAADAYQTVSTGIDWFAKAGGRERFLVCDLIPRQVHAAIQMGDLEAAERAVALLDATRSTTESFHFADGESHLAHGRLAVARLDWSVALSLLDTAAAQFRLVGATWQQMQAAKEVARACIEVGEIGRAHAVLAECHDFFDRAGVRDVQEVRALYVRAGRRPPRTRKSRKTGELSERELEVMRLANRGMTDGEIAVALKIQRRTVTTHMHHILAKRGLHSRLDLREPA